MRRLLVLALPALLGLAGCAYSFKSASVPVHLKTLEIPVVANRTLESELSEELTQALIDRFVKDNLYKVVQGDADAILEGEITRYENRVFGFNAEQRADEYIVVMAAKMTFRDRVKNRELWSEGNVQGRASYFIGSSGGAVGTEEEARALAIKQIVDFAIAHSVEGW
jgi:outer membrane lipopolysaccharide assembly protein LptE/RlpB